MRKYSLSFYLGCALLATVCFDDPRLSLIKRLFYIIFMVMSIWQLYLFYFKRNDQELDLPMPKFYKPFLYILAIFLLYNFVVDFRNPNFSLITELNHPMAALAVVPIFSFGIGYQMKDIQPFFKFLFAAGIFFCLLFAIDFQLKNAYAQSLACGYAILPFAIVAGYEKKYRLWAVLLVGGTIALSLVSDSRTIILRLLMFLALLISTSLVRRWAPLKFLIVVIASFIIYQFVANLEYWLEFFKSFSHMKSFDDEDTRTFLYNEVFGDMKSHELLMGRGFQGTYFSPYFLWLQTNNNDFTGDSYYRFSTEVGFLELLLKGGFVYFLLFITPLVAACYKGLFTRHSSRLAFGISAYILCEIFLLFIENIPAYHFQWFLVYFMAGYAYRLTVLQKEPVYEDLRYNTLLQPGPVY